MPQHAWSRETHCHPPAHTPHGTLHTALASGLPSSTCCLAQAGGQLQGAWQCRGIRDGGTERVGRTAGQWKCHPQPCPISFELPPPGALAMAMLMDQIQVFCTPFLLLLLLLFLSSACTQPVPTALGEQQSNLWLCHAVHWGPVGRQGSRGGACRGRLADPDCLHSTLPMCPLTKLTATS